MKAQETIAFNLANVTTAGFKRRIPGIEGQGSAFQTLLDKSLQKGAFPRLQNNIDFAQGDLRPSDNPLDLGLEGNGFFKISTQDGARFTRKGNFTVDASGVLVTQEGDPVVMAESGGSITQNGGAISVNDSGEVVQGTNKVGRIALVDFKDLKKLIPENGGLFRAPEDLAETPATAKVHSRKLETANVNPIEEMISMIVVSRNFDSTQRLMRGIDDVTRRSLER